MRVATDIGGTFTDLVFFEYDTNKNAVNKIKVAKTHTTPSQFEQGVSNAVQLAGIDLSKITFFAHGTTVVINAITERKGSKTGLITTKGFRDVLEIARGTRPDLYNLNFKKETPFVERHLRMEVPERINHRGEILHPLDTSELDEVLQYFKKEGVKTIAICFLHAYKNPEHEIELARIIKERMLNMEVVTSHTVSREWREYERTSSTVLSAYVKPTASKYLNNLDANLTKMGYKESLYIMQSNGGITTVGDVKINPITLIESGPASGMLGGVVLGETIGRKNLIVLDIGGTTAKCSLIENGMLKITTTYNIEKTKRNAGYPILTPVIDIVEIGNGGGSIAWLDEGGKMRVGPQSAGASPGPSSYGNGGTNITTTDANVLCNRIHADYFLGGHQQPAIDAIIQAIQPLCKALEMTKEEVARGIIRVANSNMINALKQISINKGYDPRDFSLVVIGGGGPMHGAYLAAELQMPEVIIPVNAGVYSALGMLMSDLRRDYLRTDVMTLEKEAFKKIKSTFTNMEKEAIAAYQTDGFKEKNIVFEYFTDLRYAGQEHFVKVQINKNAANKEIIAEQFHIQHKKRFSFQLEETPIEIVNFHLVAKVEVTKPIIPKIKPSGKKLSAALFAEELVDFDELNVHKAAFYNRTHLEAGMIINGPAIISEQATSTVVPPNFKVTVDDYENLILTKNDH
jgi:N-methylhydantoinase A